MNTCIGGSVRKQETKITFESHQVTVIRRGKEPIPAWCAGCNCQAQMITAGQAAALAGAGVRWVFRQIEVGNLHFRETLDGSVIICLDSLRKLCSPGTVRSHHQP